MAPSVVEHRPTPPKTARAEARLPNYKKIAIIGAGCRLPGAIDSPEAYWEFLVAGRDGVIPTPEDRWGRQFEDEDARSPGRTYVGQGGFLQSSIRELDAGFFGISPREAASLDPQQRLLMEVTAEAFDDAGLPSERTKGSRTGVFVGGFTLDNMIATFATENLEAINQHTATSSSMTLLSNRLSYVFDLRGPSMTVDTACSSSLVATHLACRALADGECDVAVVGGVSVMLLPNYQIVMCKGGFLGADGRSKAFDARGDGYGRGEGAVSLVLKPLAAALADGDPIRGVILGTGINQDGATQGIAQPSEEAQYTLIREVCQRSHVDPATIDYVEAHGTGTRAGDPVEVRAIGRCYGAERLNPLAVGSVKANFGHLEAAAGVAGLLKAVLSLQHRTIAPQVNFFEPNPEIDFAGLRVEVPVQARAIESTCARAAVNSFGYGGTNAHVIVEEAPRQDAPARVCSSDGAVAVPVSARSEPALRAWADKLAAYVDARPSLALRDLAGTLAHRRSHWEHRALLHADSREQLVDALRKLAEREGGPPAVAAEGKLAWLYTGMGPQWWAMGADLYRTRKVFRAAVDEAAEAYEQHAGVSIRTEMFRDRVRSNMDRNDVAQPANFVLQVGLTALMREFGPAPDLIIGHSVGEISAAWAAEAIGLDDAARIVAHRAALIQRVAGRGGMLALGCSAEQALLYLDGLEDVGIAAFNAPEIVTLSGGHDALAEVERRVGDVHFCKRVRVEVAYHSAHMDEVREEFLAALAPIRPNRPEFTLVSTVTGELVDAAIHDSAYWWDNARQPVLLGAALTTAIDFGARGFLEVGPHPALASSVRAVLSEAGFAGSTHYLLERHVDEDDSVRSGVSGLYEAGFAPRWDAWIGPFERTTLPSYPWQRERHWNEALTRHYTGASADAHPFLERRLDAARATWTASLTGSRHAWLKDHVIQEEPVMPGAAYIEAALACARSLDGADGETLVLRDVRFHAPLGLADDGASALQMQSSLDADGAFELRSRRGGGIWSIHATARLDREARYHPSRPLDVEALGSAGNSVDVENFYHGLAERGLAYERCFRTIRTLHGHGESAFAELDGRLDLETGYCVHPAILDGAFQALLSTVLDDSTWLPIGVERVILRRNVPLRVVAHARVRERHAGLVVGDITIATPDGTVVADVSGLRCQRLAPPKVDRSAWLHHVEWIPSSVEITATYSGQSRLWAVRGAVEPAAALNDYLVSGGARVRDRSEPVAGTDHLVWFPPDATDPGRLPVAELQALVREGCGRLTVVTRGAHEVGGIVPAPAQRAFWALGRVLMNEHPELNVRLVDLPSRPARTDMHALAAVLIGAGVEEVAIREGELLAPRVLRTKAATRPTARVTTPHVPIELVAQRVGSLDSLAFATAPSTEPGEGEIEVAVEAASLNFKDVLKVLGMLDDVALENTYLGRELGMEAAGVVARVGPGVTRFKPGDRAFLYKGGTMKTHVVVDERFAVPVPRSMSAAQAATLFVCITAWYSLVTRANLRPQEAVLIHSAAGGVGLAALQIARHLGATVIATAGTEAKRAYLRELGVEHVFDSRTLDWADEVRVVTGGQGVDVVLNALAGSAIDRGLECLASGGRFVELGKRDIAADRRLGMLPFNRNLSFIAVDLDRMAEERPAFFAPLAEKVLAAFTAGSLQPLPADVYSLRDVVSAFRALATGDQIGKVVLDFSPTELNVITGYGAAFLPDAEGSYLVTGGLDGFGLRTAAWLARLGAKRLWLASRRGEAVGAAAQTVQAMRDTGVVVEEVALDVTDEAAVTRLIERIDGSEHPLHGVFHAAVVIDDRLFLDLSEEQVAATLGAKAAGAMHLDLATRRCQALRQFVVFSSISSLVGNPGQTAYAAANGYLEGLVAARRIIEREGSSRHTSRNSCVVSWGAIAGAGVVARDVALRDHLALLGIDALPADEGLDLLGQQLTRADGFVGIVDIDWDRWAGAMSHSPWTRLERVVSPRTHPSHDSGDLGVVETLAEAAAGVFGMAAAAVESTRPLREMGLDSLMAVELQTEITRRLGVELSVMELLAGQSLEAIAAKVADRQARQTEAAPDDAARDAVASVRPDDPAERLLARICVQRPYFALQQISVDGELVRAEVVPDVIESLEPGPIVSAEAGRHLAILGSCAASLHETAPRGRHVYPVKTAVLRMNPELAPEAPAAIPCLLEAQCTAFDRAGNLASARGTIRLADGRVAGSLEVDYHVIEERRFRALMVAHLRPTAEHLAPRDTYRHLVVDSDERLQDDAFVLEFDVTPDLCLGHFPGFPTLPVSIMGRYVMDAVHGAARAQGEPVGHVVEEARIETQRFVFCGERVRFFARGGGQQWTCDIGVGDDVAATFRLRTAAPRE